jgi:hypothetical protein
MQRCPVRFSPPQSARIVCAALLMMTASPTLVSAAKPAKLPAKTGLAADLCTSRDTLFLSTVPKNVGTAEVYFVNLRDGQTVTSPFRVIFGVSGYGIAPAGVTKEKTGHHHLLIDTGLPLDLSKPIPFSQNYMHFGKGETEAVVNLPPGKHTLQLLFADAEHRPYFQRENTKFQDVLFSRKIKITVQ